MKYRPSLPQHNDNVSHQHPLREFLLILAALSGLALALFWALGLAVDAAVDRLSPELEARIHHAFAARSEARSEPPSPAEAQLARLTESLRQCAGLAYPVSVKLARSDEPNAAVLPGARILVHTGLLRRVQSQNGLAFVLAHELSHLRHRDHLRGL